MTTRTWLAALAGLILAAPQAWAKKPSHAQFASPDAETVRQYFDDNYDFIVQDLATGGGPYVEALAAVLACPLRLSETLAHALTRKLGGTELGSLDSPLALRTAALEVVRSRKVLVQQCRNINDASPSSSLPPSQPAPPASLVVPVKGRADP